MIATQVEVPPPKNPPKIATGYSDNIRDLGDKIAALSLEDTKELSEYLATQGIKPHE